jgi:uncharacterized repeat protein (TIGR03803 family)
MSSFFPFAAALACVLTFPTSGRAQPTYEILAAFAMHPDSGLYPRGGLIQGSDGNFYGTTHMGGVGHGTIFKLDPSGTLTTLHVFTENDGARPTGGVIQGIDGNFYGTTSGGGPSAFSRGGTVFRMDASGNLTTLHAFGTGEDGTSPQSGLIQGRDGSFYGTTLFNGAFGRGTIFKIDTSGTLTVLHGFNNTDGASPWARLVQGSDGSFYGTTQEGGPFNFGTVFKLDATGQLATLHGFNYSDGAAPFAGLVQGADGSLYGTTSGGGASGAGTVFKLTTSGTFTTLHEFDGSEGRFPIGGLMQGNDGSFYGTTLRGGASGSGTVFKINGTGTLTTLHFFDGAVAAQPADDLLQDGSGALLGMTVGGGPSNAGTIFTLDAVGALTTVHTFLRGSSGFFPRGRLTQGHDGNLYGTTAGGGPFGYGTIFKVDASGTLTTLHNFKGEPGPSPDPDGGHPAAGVIQGSDGSFYGTTAFGGPTDSYGTVFKLDTSGTLTTLFQFNGLNGAYPYSELLAAADGSLYGTSAGIVDGGTVFKVDPAGSVTTLHTFTGTDGFRPASPLIQGNDGALYGATYGNDTGSAGYGTFFKLDGSGTLTTLHAFDDSIGRNPVGSLIRTADGSVYGTTQRGDGGSFCRCGTVVRLDPSGTLTMLHGFAFDSGGYFPTGGLTRGGDGSVYGITNKGGDYRFGTIFKIDAQGQFAVVHTFTGNDGAYPIGSLMLGTDGNLYGTTSLGGPELGGVVFRLRLRP